jgi:hypothetical protein
MNKKVFLVVMAGLLCSKGLLAEEQPRSFVGEEMVVTSSRVEEPKKNVTSNITIIGKDEIDVQTPSDLLLLDKMTAYQAVYMLENEDVVYKQIASNSVGSGDSIQNYNTAMSAPFIAPLAVMAARGLSFKKPRSIKTGKIFQWPTYLDWRKI